MTETYRCCNEACKSEWKGKAGPPNFCPKCNGLYCEWLTFKEWEQDGDEWKKKDQDVLGDSGRLPVGCVPGFR
jgi:hypothetical protein